MDEISEAKIEEFQTKADLTKKALIKKLNEK
jgi:hypothetical protein